MKISAIAATLALLGAATSAHAASVAFSGMLGDKALLTIDGQPRGVAVGTTVAGVRLVRLEGEVATVDVDGKPMTLRLGGGARVAGSETGGAGGSRIVLPLGLGGHYRGTVAINGHPAPFVVDTGATYVAMSADVASRLGVDASRGEAIGTVTANGTVPARRLSLASVRIGDVTVMNVDCIVVQQAMPMVLLGNSFLSHFQMHSEPDALVLEKRL